MAWITPKTNWTSSDRFNIDDFTRISGNINYLIDIINGVLYNGTIEKIENRYVINGENQYNSAWVVSDFNNIEERIDKINKVIYTKNYGTRQTFYENGMFIKWDELNRIEGAILSMKNIIEGEIAGMQRLDFRLGTYREVKV